MRRMDIISAQWKPYDFLVKFLLVGDSDVGKEEILSGLVDGASESPYGYSNGMFVCIYVSVCVCMYVCMSLCVYVVCMYVCMYVCMSLSVYVCMYVSVCVCMYVYVSACACLYACMSVSVCLYVSVCVCLYVCLCICLCLCLCIMWSEVAFADVCRGHPMAGRHNLRSGSCPQFCNLLRKPKQL